MTQTRISRILSEVGSLAFPGVFDTLSARIAQRVGFHNGKSLKNIGLGTFDVHLTYI